ncbi:hypothetical protein FIBSPDRAFT_882966 [Athelia psychrophila]|uniref:Uncharacterized protein n=1 Tax=Athelia psychrophila TaxID=1759441 RepID=A0A166UXV3_9AGAM|nr:hypothetical protein FIBSPDRAFT_882966 [Fibularhizoctonia sp. CBS 109695]
MTIRGVDLIDRGMLANETCGWLGGAVAIMYLDERGGAFQCECGAHGWAEHRLLRHRRSLDCVCQVDSRSLDFGGETDESEVRSDVELRFFNVLLAVNFVLSYSLKLSPIARKRVERVFAQKAVDAARKLMSGDVKWKRGTVMQEVWWGARCMYGMRKVHTGMDCLDELSRRKVESEVSIVMIRPGC